MATRTGVLFTEGDAMSAPIGVLMLSPAEGVHGQPLLASLLVAESQRRKGVATKLLQRAEQYGKEQHYSALFAVTHPDNVATRALFAKLGYTEMVLLEKKLL